jgi:hypothetical protein
MTGSQQSGAGGNPTQPRKKKSVGGASSSHGPPRAGRGKKAPDEGDETSLQPDDDESTQVEERGRTGGSH